LAWDREGGRAGIEGRKRGPTHPIPKFLQKTFLPLLTTELRAKHLYYRTSSGRRIVAKNTGKYKGLSKRKVILGIPI
jgi:hypothetical protein